MKIETKFNIGDYVIAINNNRFAKLQIKDIKYVYNTISYSLLVRKAPTSLDKDLFIERTECNCWGNHSDVCDFLKEEFNMNKTIKII